MAKQKRMVILGAGESGTGAAVLAHQKGYLVFVSDSGTIADDYKQRLTGKNIEYEEGRHSLDRILAADELIRSPGIPRDADVIREAEEKNIPVTSEIEFAGRHTDATVIGITGTNGKTTTTLLTHHILRKAGLNAGIAGNMGSSFALQVAGAPRDYYVLELSSFQLEDLREFHIDIALILNITPDHLDRYADSMARYTDAKFRITRNQGPNDALIYCADDAVVSSAIEERAPAARTYAYSISKTEGMTGYISDQHLHINTNHNKKALRMSIFELALKGKHNLNNSMAAGIAARLIDIKNEVIRESLSDFENIEHRLEKVNTVHGIEFINDSKATNVNSAWYALESMEQPVIWIAGGIDKGNDYSLLRELVTQKVKAIICMGKDNKKIHKAFKDIVPDIMDVESAIEAVREAYSRGAKGDVVLLSPACASFDLFKSYEDRGRQFKAAVRAL